MNCVEKWRTLRICQLMQSFHHINQAIVMLVVFLCVCTQSQIAWRALICSIQTERRFICLCIWMRLAVVCAGVRSCTCSCGCEDKPRSDKTLLTVDPFVCCVRENISVIQTMSCFIFYCLHCGAKESIKLFNSPWVYVSACVCPRVETINWINHPVRLQCQMGFQNHFCFAKQSLFCVHKPQIIDMSLMWH